LNGQEKKLRKRTQRESGREIKKLAAMTSPAVARAMNNADDRGGVGG